MVRSIVRAHCVVVARARACPGVRRIAEVRWADLDLVVFYLTGGCWTSRVRNLTRGGCQTAAQVANTGHRRAEPTERQPDGLR